MNEVAGTVIENAEVIAAHLDSGFGAIEFIFNLSWLVEAGEWMEKMGGSMEVVDDWTFKAVDR